MKTFILNLYKGRRGLIINEDRVSFPLSVLLLEAKTAVVKSFRQSLVDAAVADLVGFEQSREI